MLRLGTLLTRSLTLAALCALALAACGAKRATIKPAAATTTQPAPTAKASRGAAKTKTKTKTLYIYSGLPHNGPQSAESHQIEQGIEFALAHRHKVGGYVIKYEALSDSTPQRSSGSHSGRKKKAVSHSDGWNPAATVDSAVKAARNPETVAYVGDLDSGATALSLPILNQAGIVQLTPGSGYPGLTDKVTDVTLPGEPLKFYPQGGPSLLRLVPNDIVQAGAVINWLKKESSCTKLATAAFGGSPDSAEMLNALAQTAKADKLGFVPSSPPGGNTKSYGTYAFDLAREKGVNCFVLTGRVTRAAIAFTTALNKQLPVGSVIVGTDGFCSPNWSDATRGGVPAGVAAALYCTTPVLPLKYYPHGMRFRSLFEAAYHRSPTAFTYYGYLAGTLVLKAISGIGALDSRAQVLSNLVKNNASALLTTYTFDNGDLSGEPAWDEYGLDKIYDGIPRHYKVLTPTALLQSES